MAASRLRIASVAEHPHADWETADHVFTFANAVHQMLNRRCHILIAIARYLAAHSPTERAAFQTADIARRLMLGAELHRAAGAC